MLASVSLLPPSAQPNLPPTTPSCQNFPDLGCNPSFESLSSSYFCQAFAVLPSVTPLAWLTFSFELLESLGMLNEYSIWVIIIHMILINY